MANFTDVDPKTARPAPTFSRVAFGVTIAAGASVLLNAAVAALAGLSHGSTGPRIGLEPAEYAPLTVLGVLLGAACWDVVRRKARKPRARLRMLVPVAVLVSFVPDFGILAVGASLLNALALVAMHLVVAAVTVPVLARVLPLPRDDG
ncbi:DUF6069 family protein [Amycolatopsis sp. NPDC049868]|uniref:DUF6069 family protein n=1 Tax=Amycolatopsis sp. NPDC049868 TaxID=3363934 RepID=UPI003795AB4F